MALYTSIGTPTANSYATLGEANTYLSQRDNSQAWTDLLSQTTSTAANTIKENLLIQAVRENDRRYLYEGTKYNTGLKNADDYQALEFPRSTNTDTNGTIYIPDDIKRAQFEQAIWILERAGNKTNNDNPNVNRKMISTYSEFYLEQYSTRVIGRPTDG